MAINHSKLFQIILFTATLFTVLLLLALNLNLSHTVKPQNTTVLPESSSNLSSSVTAVMQTVKESAEKIEPAATSTPSPAVASVTLHWRTLTLKHGQSLSILFEKLKIPAATLTSILKNRTAAHTIRQLPSGTTIAFGFDAHTSLQQLKFTPPKKKTFVVSNQKNHWEMSDTVVAPQATPMITQTESAAPANVSKKPAVENTAPLIYKGGSIHVSLSHTIAAAGLSPRFTSQLITMFSGRINFSRDLHAGDHFALLYQPDAKTHTNQIQIAQFTINKKPITVVRYTDPKGHTGFYTPNGNSLGFSLVRYPLIFRDISSPFSYHRLDPVLHVYRAHLGVDLAAPQGTPVKAIGDGHVEFAGVERGYGNMLLIRYNDKYESLYAHLSRFAAHIHKYTAVKMGQIVGYVGCTGYCTGAHLHYEVHVHGVPENPLRVQLPSAPGISNAYRSAFKAWTAALLQQLNNAAA